jgi:hypothetical protein
MNAMKTSASFLALTLGLGVALALPQAAQAAGGKRAKVKPAPPPAEPEPAPEPVAAPVAAPEPEPQVAQADAASEAEVSTQATPAEPPADPTQNLGGVLVRMPPSAFPEPRTRGLPGGSLWMTFHGLQWPYYPKTGIGISAYAWVDSGYEKIDRGNETEQSINYLLQQGRLLLRVTPTYTDGSFFVQGQAELVANKDQSLRQPDVADTDDLWIKVGQWNKWDLQLGRYEGWEVYHFGMGLDLNTLERQGAVDEAFSVPGIYGVTYAFNRPASVGQGSVHVYATDFLRFELGTQFGNEFGSNTVAGRPVAVFDVGWMKLKLGAEYKRLTDQKEGSKGFTNQRGLGGALQFVFLPRVEAGVNGAYGLVDRQAQDGTVDEKGSNTTYSVGGFVNVRLMEDLIAGAGLNYTYLEDLHYDPALMRVDKFNHTQMFGALQYLVAKQLYVKAVFAYGRASFAPTFGDPIFINEMKSGRIRLLYLF